MKQNKFLLNIQKEKMKELWDNKKDEIWKNIRADSINNVKI